VYPTFPLEKEVGFVFAEIALAGVLNVQETVFAFMAWACMEALLHVA
jgi:hypothetical protein